MEAASLELKLARRLGFPPPSPLVKLVAAYLRREGDLRAAFAQLRTDLGASFEHVEEYDYETAPIELFAFMNTGGDGEAYGYVLHAPERELRDYPMASFIPGEDSGLVSIGGSTLAGFENLLSLYRSRQSSAGPLSKDELAWMRKLGLEPGARKARLVRKLSRGRYVRPEPEVPRGWRYVMTSDGAGVLAPASKFDPKRPHCWRQRPEPAVLVTAAEEAMNGGFFATALYQLKEAWWLHGLQLEPGERAELKKRLCVVYRRLGRALLARRLEARFGWLK
jgi:hypothetical protein